MVQSSPWNIQIQPKILPHEPTLPFLQALVLTYFTVDGETSLELERALNLQGLGKMKTALAYNAVKFLDKVSLNYQTAQHRGIVDAWNMLIHYLEPNNSS